MPACQSMASLNIRQGYGYYLDVINKKRPTDNTQYHQWAKQVQEAFDTFQVLCALRQGPWGVDRFESAYRAVAVP